VPWREVRSSVALGHRCGRESGDRPWCRINVVSSALPIGPGPVRSSVRRPALSRPPTQTLYNPTDVLIHAIRCRRANRSYIVLGACPARRLHHMERPIQSSLCPSVPTICLRWVQSIDIRKNNKISCRCWQTARCLQCSFCAVSKHAKTCVSAIPSQLVRYRWVSDYSYMTSVDLEQCCQYNTTVNAVENFLQRLLFTVYCS